MDNQELAERMYRMSVENLRQIARLSQAVLAQGEDAVLVCLYSWDHPVFAGEFIDRLGLTTGRIANILKKLEEKRYITRTADREDRRRVYVSLTDTGRRHAEKRRQAMVRACREALDALGPEDALARTRILGRLCAAPRTRQTGA